MNKEVSFPIAQLLKERGFGKVKFHRVFSSSRNGIENISFETEKECNDAYVGNQYITKSNTTTIGYPTHTESFLEFYIPTIAEVVTWLYEKYGIWIYITQSTARLGFRCFIQRLKVLGEVDIQNDERYNSPTEAYEAAIEYTLNNLL